jgi:hypothetical protein
MITDQQTIAELTQLVQDQKAEIAFLSAELSKTIEQITELANQFEELL